MLYAFIGSTLLGALASAFLLWRKAVADKALAEAQDELRTVQAASNGWKANYETCVDRAGKISAELNDQIARANSELQTVKGQRDEALKQLANSGKPGAITDILRTLTQDHTGPLPIPPGAAAPEV